VGILSTAELRDFYAECAAAWNRRVSGREPAFRTSAAEPLGRDRWPHPIDERIGDIEMKKRLRPRLTYANVIATLALFLALGGGAAYAASHLGKGSVGAKQLKRNAVTAAKVRDGSLLARDFKAGELPRGERGAVGERGPQGAPGATSVVVRYGNESKIKNAEEGESNAKCLAGEAVTGGGFDFLEDEPANFEYFVQADRPSSEVEFEGETIYPPTSAGSAADGWLVAIANESAGTFEFRAYAMCARP
jgi:hypothetical protein